MKPMAFTKMQGLGNDFVVIDNTASKWTLTAAHIQRLADRHLGIGCDQVLLVEQPDSGSQADFKYRIFNADGSEVAQCGNGARCFARFVQEKGLSSKTTIRVDTSTRQLLLMLEGDQVRVDMGVPQHAPAEIPLRAACESSLYHVLLNDEDWTFGAVSLGNPHAVLQVAAIETAPLATVGSVLEQHSLFPERVNVGFMQIIDRQQLKLRVYERGAGETRACGSGACAAVIVGIEQGLLDQRVRVSLPGGDLEIEWQGRGQPVFMTGPAVSVFSGRIVL